MSMSMKAILKYLNCIFLFVSLTILTNSKFVVDSLAINSVAHYHHNKRQQQLTPTLTLEIEPHPGTQPSSNDPILAYYFPEQSGSFVFNCTVKHPNFRYKMKIIREQVLNNGEKLQPLEIIDSGEYKLNSVINDDRMNISMEEITDIAQNARYLKVSFIIKNLNLQDNGLYTCIYSNNVKQANVTVYKSVTTKDILYPFQNKIDKLHLNEQANIACKVNEIYPRPTVSFTHSNGNDLTGITVEKDFSNINHDKYYYYSIVSTINYTVKYTDNGQQLSCTAHSSTGLSNAHANKSVTLNVIGNQIIEDECKEIQTAKEGDKSFQITCLFFSNPKLDPEWETIQESVKLTTSLPTQPSSTDESTEPTKSEAIEEIQNEEKTIKITNDDADSNYNVAVEEQGIANSGLYKATLTIKEVKLNDFKNFTFKLKNITMRTIKLDNSEGVKRENTITTEQQQTSTASINALVRTQLHSKVFIALIMNFLITSFTLKLFR